MLSGNIKTIIDNLPYLPRASSDCETYIPEETKSSTYRHWVTSEDIRTSGNNRPFLGLVGME